MAAIAVGTLTACAPGAQAARAAAQEHVDFIAAAGGEELEHLWLTTMTDTPTAVRAAGDLLPGAAERIEVLEVGDPEDYDGSVQPASGAGLDYSEMVQVQVRYELGGTDHQGTVVLAPRTERPHRDPQTWQVVIPLMGTVPIVATDVATVNSDLYISDTRLQVDRALYGDAIMAYPAIYHVQQRNDPYLASPVEPLTVLAGAEPSFPDLQLEATEATIADLTDDVVTAFGECEARAARCPAAISRFVEDRLGGEPGWKVELVTTPALTVDGDRVVMTGGEFRLTTGDGAAQKYSFDAAAPWVIDNQSWTPALYDWQLELEVTS